MNQLKHGSPVLKIVFGRVVELPTPSNISTIWNFGSLLGLILIIQIVTGLFLSIHYSNDVSLAFERVSHICRDVNYGWIIRILHANGARFFFICLYMHVGRGLYYSSFYFTHTWLVGVVILLAVIAAAFLGYVLPWGQISFWGATVITNLFSAIPYIGDDLVAWMWGGFAVGNPTLTRFFSLHFLIPFVVAALRAIHLLFLHQTGRNNPLGLNSNFDKVRFHPYFSTKDVVGFLILIMALNLICLFYPWRIGDPENFIPANPLVTPVHIQPEWYFLIAYAILRSIPNKLGGVVALAISIIILIVCPFLARPNFRGLSFYPISKIYYWSHINIVIILTWIGARPVEDPYILIGQILRVIYFGYYFIQPIIILGWDKILRK